MKARGRLDFIAATLRAAGEGRTKTQIMYLAFLSYSRADQFLRFLVERRLLKRERGTEIYRLTETGANLLRVYDGLGDLMGIDSFAGRRLGATRESLLEASGGTRD